MSLMSPLSWDSERSNKDNYSRPSTTIWSALHFSNTIRGLAIFFSSGGHNASLALDILLTS